MIGLEEEPTPAGTEPVLEEVMRGGVRTSQETTLQEVRSRFQEEFESLDTRFKALTNPPHFPVSISSRLQRLAATVREEAVLINVSGDAS
jgi:hypothetical protein